MSPGAPVPGFTALDAAVVGVYLLAVTAWGAWMGRGQRGARDYFLGGRDLPWGVVLLSVVATETSTLTFLSIPGLAYATDLGFLQLTLGYLVGRVVVALVLLPAYVGGRLETAYALLGARFGEGARRVASALFMGTRALADGVRLFATAIPVALLTGWGYGAAILALGALTLAYTLYGGLRAVVWVDAVQLAVYVGGALAALAVLAGGLPGGLAGVFAAAGEAGKLAVVRLTADPTEPYTLWAGLLGGAFLSMASHGADQLIVQRLLACRDLRRAQAALVGSGVVAMAQFGLFLVIGLALWAHYGGRPFARTDEVFATFVIEGLPPGLTGLVVAAVLAAAMSSLSSSLNALASASTYDVWARLRPGADEAALLRAGRAFTLAWGAVLVGGALLVGGRDTPVVELGLAIASFTYGGLLGAFALALLVPRADGRDAVAAMLTGIAAMAAVVLGTALAWPWHVVLGTTVTLATGAVLAAGKRFRRGLARPGPGA